MNVQLSDIVEAAPAGEWPVITMRTGAEVSLDVERQPTLRMEIAAASRGVRP